MRFLESRGENKATPNAKNCSSHDRRSQQPKSLILALMTSHLAQPSPGLKRKRTKHSPSARSQLPGKQSGCRRDREHRAAGEELTGDLKGLSLPSSLGNLQSPPSSGSHSTSQPTPASPGTVSGRLDFCPSSATDLYVTTLVPSLLPGSQFSRVTITCPCTVPRLPAARAAHVTSLGPGKASGSDKCPFWV